MRPTRLVTGGVALALALTLVGCGSSDSGSDAAASGEGGAQATSTTAASGAGGSGASSGECATSETGKPVLDYTEQPAADLDPAKTYTATIKTTEGTVVVALDTERAPGTVDNFVALARNCYFDGTDLFRTEAQSGIIQGGSPHTQDNTDPGPGYTIQDEGGPFTSEDYAPGTIAMANTGQPDSGSAQFFFLANEGGAYLGDESAIGPSAGSYTVFGQTTEGLDVLEKIAALDDGTGVPSKQVTIESVTIAES